MSVSYPPPSAHKLSTWIINEMVTGGLACLGDGGGWGSVSVDLLVSCNSRLATQYLGCLDDWFGGWWFFFLPVTWVLCCIMSPICAGSWSTSTLVEKNFFWVVGSTILGMQSSFWWPYWVPLLFQNNCSLVLQFVCTVSSKQAQSVRWRLILNWEKLLGGKWSGRVCTSQRVMTEGSDPLGACYPVKCLIFWASVWECVGGRQGLCFEET